MVTIIIIFIIVKLAIAAVCKPKQTRQKIPVKTIKATAYQPDPQYRQLQAEIKLRQQQRKEEEKAWKQAEKQAAQAEKKRQQKEQAAADTLFYQSQLETIVDLLTDVEGKINAANWNIEIDKRTRSLDKMQFHQRQKESLVKKQMQYETKIHSLESKLAKCYYIINS